MLCKLKRFSRAIIIACVAITSGYSVAQADEAKWESFTNTIDAFGGNPLLSNAEYVPYSASTRDWEDAIANKMALSEVSLLGTGDIVWVELKPHLGQMNSIYQGILKNRSSLTNDGVQYPAVDTFFRGTTEYMMVDLKPHLQASEQIASIVNQPESQITQLADLKPHLATTVLAAWN